MQKNWIFPPICYQSERPLLFFFMLRYSSGEPLQMPIILISSNLLNTRWTNLSNPLFSCTTLSDLKVFLNLNLLPGEQTWVFYFLCTTISDWILCKFKIIIKTFNAIQVFFQFIDSAIGKTKVLPSSRCENYCPMNRKTFCGISWRMFLSYEFLERKPIDKSLLSNDTTELFWKKK